jgi:hypothetical protein
MAIEPEFVRLMKRWIRSKTDTQSTTMSSSSGIKPLQLDDDEDDLR